MSASASTQQSGTSTDTTTKNASSTKEEAKVVIPDTTATLLTTDVYGMFVGGFFIVLSLIVLFSTGSILSVLVLWAVIALVITVLVYYGIVSIDQLIGKAEKEVKKEVQKETPYSPPSGAPLLGSEVFHVSEQQFTYDEAPAVCAAYGADMATLEQIMDAYSKGAEWCGYGWSAGGMALYPTQRSTWERLQGEVDYGKRTRCGRPGVNGGYFDPALKFGVNCFGFKPKGKFTPPGPVPGVDTNKFREMVRKFREMLKTLTLDPYSRQEWSEYGNQKESFTLQTLFAPLKQEFFTPYGSREDFGEGDPRYVEPLSGGNNARPLQAPYGLLGDKGEKGAVGPAGSVGAQGNPGKDGSKGEVGPIGPKGADGKKGDTGETGKQGVPGSSTAVSGLQGPKGNDGAKGDAGPKGDAGGPGGKGDRGLPGEVGPQGPAGPQGVVPRNLSIDTLRIGDWNINPVQNGTALKVQKDGTKNPITITQAGRLFSAWPYDYDETNPNNNETKIARGQSAETWNGNV